MAIFGKRLELSETEAFRAWLSALDDQKARLRILARLTRLRSGNFGDAKSVGGKVSELKVDYGPGYRVYITRTGKTVYLLLCGGDKSTQAADIERAKEMVKLLDT